MKIGLSYDQGSPKYRLYVGALMAAAEQRNIDVQPFWLASPDRDLDATALETIDGLLLTGGADVEPARYGREDAAQMCGTADGRDPVELRILERAFERRLPTLAICRGMQLINVYQGGTLVPHLEDGVHQLEDGQRHDVRIDGTSALSRLLDATRGEVTSSHHQAVDSVGKDLRAVSHHADGTIEAIEWIQPLRKPWLAAVQWHPERMALHEPLAGALFCGFLEAVAAAHG